MNPLDAYDRNGLSEDELVRYHLGELAPARVAAVSRALARNPALLAEAEAFSATLTSLKDVPMNVDRDVLDRNWKALRPALVAYRPVVARAPRWHGAWLGGALAAGAAGMAFLLWHHAPHGEPAPAPVPVGSTETPGLAPEWNGHSGGGLKQQGSLAAAGTSDGYGTGMRLRADVFRADAGRTPVHLLGLAPAFDAGRGALRADGGRPEEVARNAGAPLPLTAAPNPGGAQAPTAVEERGSGNLSGGLFSSSIDSLGQTSGGIGTQGSSGSGAPTNGTQGGHRKRHDHVTDVTLAMGGMFIAKHTSTVASVEQQTQSNTHAVVALGSFHQQFGRALGYRVTASYTRPEFQYSYVAPGPGGFYQEGYIGSRIYELAGTYVIEGPHRGRVSTAGDVGGALMAFLPTSDADASYMYRGAAVLGASVDVALTKHLSARAGYRAQVFKGPDFRYVAGTVPVSVSVRVSQEPSLGITYKFGRR